MPTRFGRGAYAALVIVTLIWAFNWLVMKVALRHADPFVFNVHRTVLALLVLFGVLLARRGPLLPESWTAVAVTGFFQVTVNFLATTVALVEGGAGRTSVLVFTMPFWTLLMAWPVLGERPRGAQWIAILLAFAGLLLIVAPWHWEGSLAPKLYAVVSGFGWAAATIATKAFQRARRYDTINFVAWSMLLGLLPFFAIALWRDAPAVSWTLSYALLVGYAGVLAIAVAWLLWFVILHRLSASAASFSMLAIPVLTLGASIAVFGEQIESSEWVGIGLVATALLVLGMLGLSGARGAVPRVAAGKG